MKLYCGYGIIIKRVLTFSDFFDSFIKSTMKDEFVNSVRGQRDHEGMQKNQTSNWVKLTNAVYKVLDFFPESDPLKNRAKDKALAIMERLVTMNETKPLSALLTGQAGGRHGWATLADVFSEEKIRAHLLEDIDMLLGYLWIGKSQGWLSSTNCLIIANEYEKIKKDIEPVIEFTKKLPGIDDPIQEPPASQKDIQSDHSVSSAESVQDAEEHDEVEISARQEKILEFLRKNEKAQVMDLQAVVPDITKRTIRRDLDELLESGKIVRLGDFNQVFYMIKR